MSAKSIPMPGQGLNGVPPLVRSLKITAGYGSSYDIDMAAQAVYPLATIQAGSVIHEVATQVKSGFGSSATLVIGDTGDDDCFLLDTDIVPNTTATVLTSSKVTTSSAAAKAGKAYAADTSLIMTLGGADVTGGNMDIYIHFTPPAIRS